MLVGVPKEIKDSEYRVGLVPSTAGELIANGHPYTIRVRRDERGWAMRIMKRWGRKSFRAPMKSMHARNSS
jgi:hypothetical protein